jgi:hypothetical protein
MFEKLFGRKRIQQAGSQPDPAIRQAEGSMGHEKLREQIEKALSLRFPTYDGSGATHYVVEIFDDGRCIIRNLDGNLFEIKYTVEGETITLASEMASVKAETQYIRQEATGHFLQAVEAAEAEAGWEWEVVLIQAGLSKTRYYFPVEVLQASVPLFEGRPAFMLNEAQHVDTPLKKPPGDIVGWYDQVRMSGDKMIARLRLLKTADKLRQMLMSSWEKDKKDLLGLSVDCEGPGSIRQVGGQKVLYITKIQKVNGTDIVWDPAAGGAFVKILAAATTQTKEEDQMKDKLLKLLQARRPDLYGKINVQTVTEDELTHLLEEAVPVQQAAAAAAAPGTQPIQQGSFSPETTQRILMADLRMRVSDALAATTLPDIAKARVRNRFDGKHGLFPDDATIQQAITEEREYLGQLTESGRVVGFGDTHVQVEGESERIQMAFHKMFGVQDEEVKKSDIAPFTSIREAYGRVTGDKDVRGFIDPKMKIQQAITNATFDALVGNAMYRRLLQDYREANYGERNIITVGSAPDFRTRESIRLGYFGDIADVDPETNDYQEIAAPTDEKVSYAVGQKGNILTITRKTIINDDLRGITRMVSRLGRAARRTFAQFVWNMWINNVTLDYDSTAWFHSNHGNTGTTALSAAEILVVLTALANMTEQDSGKTLGLNFSGGINSLRCWLVVPNALWGTAHKENMREFLDSNLTPNPIRFAFGQNGERIIVNPLLSDATNWGIFRDPSDVESIVVDFLNGQEEPEFFLADQPTVGQMFVGDKLQWKIRHEYGGDVVDHRGAYKEVVAG